MNKDNEEWGNIELPGLSDEELFAKNWNRVAAAREIVKAREKNGWKEKNEERFKDDEYIKKLSSSIKSFYEQNPDFHKQKISSEQWITNQKIGMKTYVEDPNYVNPRGMLNKTRSEESRKKASDSLKGHIKPLEGNKKISQSRKGRKPKEESIKKMKEKLLGRETDRSRKVQTPAGIFEKLRDAADYYEVAPGSIKNFINGQNVKEWFKPYLESKGVKFDCLKPLGFNWLGDAKKELGAKRIQTPDGIFNNAKEAAEYYKITTAAIRYRIKSQPDKYKKLD
jgi:hypothetical protein